MADLFPLRAIQFGSRSQAADLLQRTGDAARLSGELDGGGVGQVLPLPGHRGLDQAAGQDPDPTRDKEGEADDRQWVRAGLLVPAPSGAGKEAAVQQGSADDGEEQDAEQQPDEADVQAHVAVHDVAELVRDHALQLVAVEPVQCAGGDGNGRVRSGPAGRERVDALFVRQQIHLGHGCAGRDGHLLDHVAQPSQPRIGRVLRHVHAAQLAGHPAPAAAQSHRAHQRGEPDRGNRHDAGDDEHPGQSSGRGVEGVEGERGGEIHDENDADDGHDEQHNQARRHPAHLALPLEEVHLVSRMLVRRRPAAPGAAAGRPSRTARRA